MAFCDGYEYASKLVGISALVNPNFIVKIEPVAAVLNEITSRLIASYHVDVHHLRTKTNFVVPKRV